MGLGDEILALGRAEKIYKETGKAVAICNDLNQPRQHPAWIGNPAVDHLSAQKIKDGAGCRPYILKWNNSRIIFDEEYRPIAGKIWLTLEEKEFNTIQGDYIVVAPTLKSSASPNKNWGEHNFEKVISKLNIPVYQLMENKAGTPINGAIPFYTPTFRKAASIISKAKLVLCNEGGSHHMAASFGVPAVVIFGSFISPKTTGYPFHINIHRETSHGYCGDWSPCKICKESLESITPDEVLEAINKIIGE